MWTQQIVDHPHTRSMIYPHLCHRMEQITINKHICVSLPLLNDGNISEEYSSKSSVWVLSLTQCHGFLLYGKLYWAAKRMFIIIIFVGSKLVTTCIIVISGQRQLLYCQRIWIYYRYKQMDFQFALWQMLYLFISPQKVYRNFSYRKRKS